MRTPSFPYGDVYHRTVAEIQRDVIKQGKRNVVYRALRAKANKDKIASWKKHLLWVLNVFNVRSIGSVMH